MFGGFRALALGVERGGEVEARLMVERIGGNLSLQLIDRSDRFGLLGDVERGARGGDRRFVALGLRHHGERLLGLLERAGLHIAARETGERRDIAAILSQKLPVKIGGLGGVASGERGIGFFQQILFLGADLALGHPLEERDHLGFGQRAHETVDRLAVGERDHRRDRLDSHLAGNFRMLVDIHLGELDLALGRLHRLFQDRGELLARSAPGRPEIDQHRLALGFLDHVLEEALRGRLNDRAVGHRRHCPAVLQHCSSRIPLFAGLWPGSMLD